MNIDEIEKEQESTELLVKDMVLNANTMNSWLDQRESSSSYGLPYIDTRIQKCKSNHIELLAKYQGKLQQIISNLQHKTQ